MAEERAVELLRISEYGVLSLADAGGLPYGIPVNYVWDGASSIYIHCAPEGRKLRCLAYCPAVSFCIVGSTRLAPEKFTTSYESIVLSCRAVVGLPQDERRRALAIFLEKYSPRHLETGLKYAEKSFHRTEIIRLDIVAMSGKCKKVPASNHGMPGLEGFVKTGVLRVIFSV